MDLVWNCFSLNFKSSIVNNLRNVAECQIMVDFGKNIGHASIDTLFLPPRQTYFVVYYVFLSK